MENIEVGLRIRPLNQTELSHFEKNPWVTKSNETFTFDDNYESLFRHHKTTQVNLRNPIKFNYCFDENITNVDIYKKMVEDVIISSLEGINGTVFMYGQTGSGKTFTMLGTLYDQTNNAKTPSKECGSQGIIMSAIKGIFDKITEVPNRQFTVKCSYLEIYNDLVYDLLANQKNFGDPLIINQDANKEFFIPETNEEIVNNYDEIIEKLFKGEAKRHYASTVLNHVSSRSHTIFRLLIKSVEKFSDSSKECIKESILNFVDLAGSEKLNYVSKENSFPESNRSPTPLMKFSSPASSREKDSLQFSANLAKTISKDRFKESQHINKSLFFLTTVISLISQGKKEIHIPYRNSPLTKILKGALGGNSRTRIILCINPCLSQLEQSLNTIRFGLCANKIQNNIKINCIFQSKPEIMATSTDKKPEKKKDFCLDSDNKIRKNLFSKPSIEDLEKKNIELARKNVNLKGKSLKSKRKIKKLQKSLKIFKEENCKYKKICHFYSGEDSLSFLNPLSTETLEVLENNLNLALDQIKLRKFIKESNFINNNDSFRNYFLDVLEQKAANYSKNLEIKRRIPCDLLQELEKLSIFKSSNTERKDKEKHIDAKLNKVLSNENEKNEENLLSNVSHLYEEKFDIENIID